VSRHRTASPPGRARAWISAHAQRLAYVLVAASLGAVVGASIDGGILLHRAAELQRQTLRTQSLGGVAFRLQNFVSRAQTEGGVSATLAAERKRAFSDARAAFARIRMHNRDESDRIRDSYVAYLRASTRAFEAATAGNGSVPVALQRQVEGRLAGLESRVDAEIAQQGRRTRQTTPEARLALIVVVLAAAFLVAMLIWQFELQRRSGRMDRDNAARSQELMRLRDDFVATVSHELRTPLTSILGYLELIAHESVHTTPEQEEFLPVVQRNAERLLRLVSDLLLVAEVDDRRLALDFRAADLSELATESVEAAKPAADAKQIDLTLSHAASGGLEGDPIRLAQMMDNLVSNAIKFTPTGGEVRVSTGAVDGHVVFEVADSGLGISAADQAQLFEPFFRTRGAAEHAVPGTGLGLTITKAIVEAHHGSITVESAGTGTTFRVRLPRTRDAEAEL
jgi:signal transduction histidine kinase